ncbi:peptidase M28 [Candidatus Magnetomorum sp. HK-1]|nr:peptidase M28 [Candidatus Magnetomorum sp. HK-1]
MNNTSQIDNYLKKIFPITRSLTGKGNRETLKILQEIIPLSIIEYPTGQAVYDWIIPKEWKIKDAWIKDSSGKKIIDFKNSNLHVVSYSIPIHQTLSFAELEPHLHYREDIPDAIPYRTSYYKDNWGFCLSFKQFKSFFDSDDNYEVMIDSDFIEGSLSIGELVIEGKSKTEYLLSTYICHPSLANDNLSGIVTTAFIAKELLSIQDQLEYSYRIVFAPETIGSIAYCANNELHMKRIKAGLVLTTCGGPGSFGYKQSWDINHEINAMIEDVFNDNQINYKAYPFDIRGSDERQYSSPGFRINCVTLTKSKYYEYPFYHTSLDNLDFVTASQIQESLDLYLQLIGKMDKNLVYQNSVPNCEVMLSKHGLYPETGGAFKPDSNLSVSDILLWILFYCDGKMSLYEISKRLKISLDVVFKEAKKLERKQILVVKRD